MVTLKVRKVSTPKTKSGERVVVFHLTNGKPNIIRNVKQFLTDLTNSFLIQEGIEDLNHPQVTAILRDLKNFTITGEVIHVKEGEQWTVTENSSIVTDPKHPLHGQKVVGDKVAYTADMSIVEDGFLDVELNPLKSMENKQALAYASSVQAMMSTSNAFDFGSNDVDTKSTDEIEIPDDLVTEATAGTKSIDKKGK